MIVLYYSVKFFKKNFYYFWIIKNEIEILHKKIPGKI